MKKMLCLFALLFTAAFAYAQSPVGKWKTIDDETGKEKSIVEVYEQGGKVYAKIIKLLNKPADTLCDQCPGDKKNKPIVGMVFVNGLKKDGSEYAGGEILDPAKGKTYKCKMWLEGGKLMVRGYVGPFFRTQTWHRI